MSRSDPGVLRPKSLWQSTAQVNLRPPAGQSRQDDPERSKAPMDVSTDPDPNMDVQQAHVRNMRSKCRCSCVLQFTLRHGVSSVLHRPPSQMIHCIVLYLWFPAQGQWFFVLNRFHKPNMGGARNPSRRRGSLKLNYRLSKNDNGAQHLRLGSRSEASGQVATSLQARLSGQRQASRDPEVNIEILLMPESITY